MIISDGMANNALSFDAYGNLDSYFNCNNYEADFLPAPNCQMAVAGVIGSDQDEQNLSTNVPLFMELPPEQPPYVAPISTVVQAPAPVYYNQQQSWENFIPSQPSPTNSDSSSDSSSSSSNSTGAVRNAKPKTQTAKSTKKTAPGPKRKIPEDDLTPAEREALKKRRQRNRKAAQQCRQRKMEKIQSLEEEVASLKSQISEMNSQLARYRKRFGKI